MIPKILQIIFISVLCFVNISWAESQPKILILNSYHQGDVWSDNEVAGILSTIRGTYPFLVPAIEHLDAKRFPGSEHLQFFSRYLENKYMGKNPDIIFALDNPALDLLTGPGSYLFSGVPVIIAGINGYTTHMIKGRDRVAGVAEVQDMAGTLDLALSLHPRTKSVLAVHDYTSSGLAVRKDMDAVADHFRGKVVINYTPYGTIDDLVVQLKSLPSDSLVMLLTYVTDKAGRMLSREESTHLITDSSPVPVYAMHEMRLSHGIIGGMLLEGREHGMHAAEIALRILSKKDKADYAVEKSRSRPVFDYNQLVRFKVPVEKLPQNSTLINRPASFFQEHRKLIMPGLIITFSLMSIIIILSVSIANIRKSKRALETSEEKYRLAMDAVKDGLWDWNIRTNEVYYSPGWNNILGISDPGIDYKTWVSRIFPANKESVLENLKRHLEGHTERWEQEHMLQTEDGGWKWVLGRGTVVERDRSGIPIRMVGTMTDITDRKTSEKILRDNEEKYRTLLESTNAVAWEFDLKLNRWTYVAPQAESVFGFAPNEWKDFEFWENRLHPEDREPTAQRCMFLTEKGEDHILEYRFLKKNGDMIWIRDIIQVKTRSDRSKILRGYMFDITEDKQAEEALLESENKFKGFAEHSFAGIYLIQDGVFKYVNPRFAEIFGYSVEECTQMHYRNLVFPDDLVKVEEQVRRRISGEVDFVQYKFKGIKKGGKVIDVEIYGSSVSYNGKPAAIGTMLDITERKQAVEEREKLKEQLNQAQKMEAIGQLAGGVAHDFNNKLNIILGYTQMALMKTQPSDPLNTNLQEIMNAAKRSADLVHQLLAFARKQTIAPKAIDLNDTVPGMLNMLRRLIGEHIELIWMPAANLWPVKMDSSQLDQILANLVVNARDSISGVGKITIETGKAEFDEAYCAQFADFVAGQYVMLAVSDNGSGMEKDTVDKIFEPFFTTKELGKGTGMGLATVYGIVKQNNGFINVYTEPGKGTTFRIYLSRFDEEKIKSLDQITHVRPLTGTETILLVEDEKILLELGKFMLEEMGYNVITAGTPGEAIRLAEEHTGDIHLVMTDVIMPEMNGLDLQKQLNTVRQDMKYLFMSGYPANVIAHHGILKEGVHLLQKPFQVEAVAANVRKALDS